MGNIQVVLLLTFYLECFTLLCFLSSFKTIYHHFQFYCFHRFLNQNRIFSQVLWTSMILQTVLSVSRVGSLYNESIFYFCLFYTNMGYYHQPEQIIVRHVPVVIYRIVRNFIIEKRWFFFFKYVCDFQIRSSFEKQSLWQWSWRLKVLAFNLLT